MKFYTLLMAFASPYVIHLYNLATKTPEQILKKQTQSSYFRHIRFKSPGNQVITHKLEEYRSPGISYRHLLKTDGNFSEEKIYPLDSFLIRKIFFEYFYSFKDE